MDGKTIAILVLLIIANIILEVLHPSTKEDKKIRNMVLGHHNALRNRKK